MNESSMNDEEWKKLFSQTKTLLMICTFISIFLPNNFYFLFLGITVYLRILETLRENRQSPSNHLAKKIDRWRWDVS